MVPYTITHSEVLDYIIIPFCLTLNSVLNFKNIIVILMMMMILSVVVSSLWRVLYTLSHLIYTIGLHFYCCFIMWKYGDWEEQELP